MLRGLATVNFYADDHDAAKAWYAELLDVKPYYEAPGYAEFRTGDYQHELGLVDGRFRPPAELGGPSGAIAYWHVDDLAGTLERLLALGATEHLPIRKYTKGFAAASAVDPFGNILGIMNNPHYLEILAVKG